ncbi:proteoglycan 4a [Scleropages formosus]|uniref:proteoglycan 4a n=1 Tax=Scleropages formosus TaxID=113540 RepID=UPI0010FA653A|nr:proteoglycan 4-like [Scleropages formosus]
MASSSGIAGLFALACFLLPLCAAQATCKGRCGEPFSRGRICHCDRDCLLHNECCKDYESACTTGDSCVGRCGEPFKRGRLCNCDPSCALYDQCCPDYRTQCAAETTTTPYHTKTPETAEQRMSHIDAGKNKAQELPKKETVKKPGSKLFLSSPKSPDSESEEVYPVENKLMNTFPQSTQQPEMQTLPTEDTLPLPSLNEPAQAAGPLPDGTGHRVDPAAPDGVSTLHLIPVDPATVLLESAAHQLLPFAPGLGQPAPDLLTPSPGKPTTTSLEFAVFAARPVGSPTRPNTLGDIAAALAAENTDSYLTNISSDTNLCNLQPIDGVTVLFNGTIVVFRGDFFWTLDNSWAPSPARRITEVWGVPSPIDTVFTRSNCRSKTYIFKGNNYWRFENGILDPGYPKFISVEFEGFDMSGKIVAALPVPATRRRPESVYFFRTGGRVQKYSFGPEATSSCRRKFPIVAGEKQPAGQAASPGNEINIRVSWKGFPSLVTSAVSVPNPHKPDGYDYYIFSNDKYYIIKVVGERLALATTPNRASQDNSAHRWLKCPLASR